MDDDWDLQAVVRGCAASFSSASATTSSSSCSTCCLQGASRPPPSPPSIFQPHQDEHFLCFPDLFEPKIENRVPELQDLFKPFFPTSQPPMSSLSVLGDLQDVSPAVAPAPDHRQQKRQPGGSRSSVSTQTARSKRRKNQLKRVCHVPAEDLSSDTWSWRKYGQKPIKGSPYPRGYYRCSTSRGCLARKQVERNRSEPGMFIVTYTGDHNHPMPTHRNSLAGSSRQKPVNSQVVSPGDPTKPSCSPPVSPATSLSPMTKKMDSEEQEDFGVSDPVVDEDFFADLEDFAGSDFLDCFSGDLQASSDRPWLAHSATTTAAGGY